jgi:hypothetical protein
LQIHRFGNRGLAPGQTEVDEWAMEPVRLCQSLLLYIFWFGEDDGGYRIEFECVRQLFSKEGGDLGRDCDPKETRLLPNNPKKDLVSIFY